MLILTQGADVCSVAGTRGLYLIRYSRAFDLGTASLQGMETLP